MNKKTPTPHDKLWDGLRKYTEARIGLGHAGGSITTEHHLAFQYAHACAQDAVWRPLDWNVVTTGLAELEVELVHIKSKAVDRDNYLQRPDYGRQLSYESRSQLIAINKDRSDVVIVIADGLSSTAIEQNAVTMVSNLIDTFKQQNLSCPYVFLASQARVALGDEVAQLFNAKHLILLVGERPGLSSPNSLGIYYTYCARAGYTDAKRNCISNVRSGGQSISAATKRLMWLLNQAEVIKQSGVQLKDESDSGNQSLDHHKNILIP